MPTSASRSAIDRSVACRMSVLAPWPRTSRCVAPSGRISRAETSPFPGVARNFISWALCDILGPSTEGVQERDLAAEAPHEPAERPEHQPHLPLAAPEGQGNDPGDPPKGQDWAG